MTALLTDRERFLATVRDISRNVAAPSADEVDRDARFPTEAIGALREVGALSAWVPTTHGGGGFDLAAIGVACHELARGCSATAMIFAMHQLQVANLVRHLGADEFLEDYLRRVSDEQRLVASITSEIGTGGDMARSIAALEPVSAGRFRFTKQAPTISYGAHSDDLLTTLRRSPDADSGDQVMVLHARADTEMEAAGAWDTLGMRGTCSPGFTVHGEVGADQILSAPFAAMMTETIVPISHILWSHVWLGIGAEAFERGQAYVRKVARQKPGEPLAAARRLSETSLELRLLRSELAAAVADFERWDASDARAQLNVLSSAMRFNSLKLAVSERVPRICQDVLSGLGIVAYRNDSPYAVGRLLRDSLSGQLMIANERIHSTNASLLAIAKDV